MTYQYVTEWYKTVCYKAAQCLIRFIPENALVIIVITATQKICLVIFDTYF